MLERVAGDLKNGTRIAVIRGANDFLDFAIRMQSVDYRFVRYRCFAEP